MHLRPVSTALLPAITLAACSVLPAIQSAPAGRRVASTVDVSPVVEPGSMGCYYTWATRDLPDVAANLEERLRRFDPNIVAGAYAFGEDCSHEGGDVTFLAKETDFRVHISLPGFDEHALLGKWIRRTFDAIAAIPPSNIPGPQPGRVEFEFQDSNHESLRMNIEILRFMAESAGLTDDELYLHFVQPH